MRESAIQAKIRKYAILHGWCVVKLITCSVNGLPDLLLMKAPRRVLFIEVKGLMGIVSDLQYHRINELRAMGFEVIVAKSIDDVKEAIN